MKRGVWHGEAWDVPQERFSKVEASHFMANLAAVAQERDEWRRRSVNQERDMDRMRHVMDQRAEIIAHLRKQMAAASLPNQQWAALMERMRANAD